MPSCPSTHLKNQGFCLALSQFLHKNLVLTYMCAFVPGSGTAYSTALLFSLSVFLTKCFDAIQNRQHNTQQTQLTSLFRNKQQLLPSCSSALLCVILSNVNIRFNANMVTVIVCIVYTYIAELLIEFCNICLFCFLCN